ncbi:MAG TPA: histidine kinase, partial [Desulfobacterales bacterium]|nr:histidine kinase [Desulfobacterales bacterium]
GSSPYYLFKEINKQPQIKDLYPLAGKTVEVVRHLLKEGAQAGNITRMISIINDEIVKRLLILLEEELGPPPLPYCWLLLGSEGRREQTFRTDQDNALVYADPPDEETARRAAAYFERFAKAAIDHLVACGYPLCPGEIMASNPKWRQPLAVWKQYFDRWIMTPEAEQILHATIFFDFRPRHGAFALADDLRRYLLSRIRRQEIFLLHLARECLTSKAPLSFFKNFIVEKDGAYRNRLDIKHRGIAPFVNFARVLALKHGVKETNTLARLKILAEEGQISNDLATQARHAYEFQMYLRIVHQLQQIDDGEEPDNYIDPSQLSDLEKRTLKEAFSTIERLQEALRTIFPLR